MKLFLSILHAALALVSTTTSAQLFQEDQDRADDNGSHQSIVGGNEVSLCFCKCISQWWVVYNM
jgi:hypothetical protein